jgi:D-alanine-D-alanine ligase
VLRVSEKKLIALVFGGRSVEHEVSIRSATSVLGELEQQGWDVLPVAVDPEGRWFTSENPLQVRKSGAPGGRIPVYLQAEANAPLVVGEGSQGRRMNPDLYLPLIHGQGGEDGTLQGLFELAGVPYAGSGVLASALAMDKDRAKAVLRQEGLPVLDWCSVQAGRWNRSRGVVLDELNTRFPGPVFVKPANGGSSVGISRVSRPEEMEPALEQALALDLKALVEPALDAREVEVSVLGNDDVSASVAGEIVAGREFYDYRAKYSDTSTQLLIPAPIESAEMERLSALACSAYQALGCSGFGRIDFLLDRATGEPFISEVNTLPGFTDVSMFPALWEASGMDYGKLLARIVELGCERHRARSALCHQRGQVKS